MPPTLQPTRDSPLGDFGGHWSFVMKSGQMVRSQFCALCGVLAVCAGVPSCWKMNLMGRRRLLRKNDNLVIHCLSKRHFDIMSCNMVNGF